MIYNGGKRMFTDMKIGQFSEELASNAPVPGGGGASALCGALAAALASMVANLTLKSAKYQPVHGDMEKLAEKATELRLSLLRLIDEDALAFEPLSQAYKLPKATDAEKISRRQVLEAALKEAVKPPLAIIQTAKDTLDLLAEAKDKGTKMAVSDVGVGALFAVAAMRGAALNVYINTALMEDRKMAHALEKQCRAYESDFERGRLIYEQVEVMVCRKS
jgi:methenyltetrahydrofolate cyclohydrolase